jgi:hypothetical protein
VNGEPCPVCGASASHTVGPVYSGATRTLWRKRRFEEQLYRCREGHIYSVRREGEHVAVEPHESVDEWLEQKTGEVPPERPPGL